MVERGPLVKSELSGFGKLICDSTRAGKNFAFDRRREALAMAEISDLDDLGAFLK